MGFEGFYYRLIPLAKMSRDQYGTARNGAQLRAVHTTKTFIPPSDLIHPCHRPTSEDVQAHSDFHCIRRPSTQFSEQLLDYLQG